jgi:hypothetical protein
MQKKATIIGTQEGCYLACLDDEKEQYHCDEEYNSCSHPCRILLDKDQQIEKGRKVLAEINPSLFASAGKLNAILAGIFIVVFVLMMILRRTYFPLYRGYFAMLLSGFFASSLFYLIVKSRYEKSKSKNALPHGKIVRVFPRDESI